MRCAAVVLCAGRSSRLPRFKPLLPLCGSSMVARAARLFREAQVEEIVAVTGHRADEVAAEAARHGMRPIFNPQHHDGMFTSVIAGLRSVPERFDNVFLLPVDIPFVRPATVRTLMDEMRESPAPALIPTFRGQAGHPPLISAQSIPFILSWRRTGGLASALTRIGMRQVPVGDAQILFDVDDDAAFAEAEARCPGLDIPSSDEALALLDLHHAGPRGHAHARGVADAALALARALMAKGHALDLQLIESSALLHDIAKGQPRHEQTGGRILQGLGFPLVAEIVAAHRDIDPAGLAVPSERELVYLADKLVRGPERITIRQRFQEKLDHFADDSEACRAIRNRLEHALQMQQLVEACAGRPVGDILLLPHSGHA